MSGLEVVGVVLGSIPLLISALEHYSNGLTALGNMKQYEHAFKDLLAQFIGAASLYHDTCESILISDLTVERVNKLLKTRDGALWRQRDVEDLLRRKLGTNFQTYVSISNILGDKIQKLGKRLKLEDDFRPRWVGIDGSIDFKVQRKLLKSGFARITGGIKIPSLQRDVESIVRDLYFLEKFQTKALLIEPQRIEKRHQSVTNSWGKLSERAKWLFESLNSQFYQCRCHCVHQADLELKVPMKPTEEFEWNKERLVFEFSISGATPVCSSMPWSWRGVEIEAEESDLQPFVGVIQAPSWSSHAGMSFIPSFPPVPTYSAATPIATTPQFQTRVDDLCKALSLIQLSKPNSYLGFLESQKWKHHIFCSDTTKPTSHTDGYSLEDLLYSIRIGTAWRSGVFTPRERALVALNMAYAVLQFHSTAWLQEDWGIKDVFVRQENSRAAQISTIYLSRKFDRLKSAPARRNMPWIRNEIIYSLGLALLEIIYCQPISAMVQQTNYGSSPGQIDPSTEFVVAGDLARDLSLERRGMVSASFAAVTRICLWCDFQDPTNDLSDPGFRQRFYAMVVEPLAEEYMRAS
ncbi:hypothetical protein TWF225_002782 [Orbilia oligospora]|nr:hypothetical protein TWF225_002782 [Orbilia oligospora]KAF3253769.1 hypothetical protein TWF128_006387 [Orbilia oligospora]KAF3297901.1 hypothetical protein TWF132_004047 [Orbilia oligospora]